MRNPDNEIFSNLQARIASERILSSCYYYLYGYYDVLLRIWATSQKRQRLIQALKEYEDNIENVSEFQARNISYLWGNGRKINYEEAATTKTVIARVANSALTNSPLDVTDVGMLIDKGILHKLPAVSKGSIKFYIALTKIPGSSEIRSEFELLKKGVESLQLQNVSIYHGMGFAKYLIKAIASHYNDIINTTVSLIGTLKPLDLRPMTLLIANEDAKEADILDTAWADLTPSMLQLEFILGATTLEEFGELSADERKLISEIVEENTDLFSTNFGSIFKAFLTSKLKRDAPLFFEKLSFLLRLESMLNRFLVSFLSKELGKQWFEVVQKTGSACGLPQKKSANEYTLHEIFVLLRKLYSDDAVNRSALDEALGTHWQVHFESALPLRNDYAHGRLFGNVVIEKWSDLMRVILPLGRIYNKLIERTT